MFGGRGVDGYCLHRGAPPTKGRLAGRCGFYIYGILRFGAEFFREPDAHLGFVFWNFSMGQLLSAPMLLIGVVLIFRNQLFSMMTRMLSGERVPAIHGDAVRGVVWGYGRTTRHGGG